MKQQRIEELLKAARQRVNGPPGSRGITLLPEEVLEILEGQLVVETTEDIPAMSPQAPASVGTAGSWDAVGRIAAAFIAKQPPTIRANKVADYVVDVLRDVRQKAEI